MNKLKELQEKRDALITEMTKLNEERKFEEFNVKDDELRQVENEIRLLEMQNTATDPVGNEEDEEVRTLADEVREAILTEKEIDISNIEMRDMGMTTPPADGNTSVKNLGKQTFANYIIKKLPEKSRLYAATRKEPFGSSTHSIPVQKNKIGKFVNVKEFAEYAKKNADYSVIKMEAHKYGTLVVLSEESLEDTAYNIEADVREQIEEGYAETIDELIVKGDSVNGVEGLNSFSTTIKGVKAIAQKTKGEITMDELEEIYFALPKKYRKRATWVFNDATAKQIAKLKDADGKPLLFGSFNEAPFGEGSKLLGRPVIVCDECDSLGDGANKKPIFFGDLTRAIIVGPRKIMTIKVSNEVGFLEDTKAIKASTRLDIKRGLEEAMVYFKGIA